MTSKDEVGEFAKAIDKHCTGTYDHLEYIEKCLRTLSNRRAEPLIEALINCDSDLSYLRHRGGIDWDRLKTIDKTSVDLSIAQSRSALANDKKNWGEG